MNETYRPPSQHIAISAAPDVSDSAATKDAPATSGMYLCMRGNGGQSCGSAFSSQVVRPQQEE
jgi:hypothetical protein